MSLPHQGKTVLVTGAGGGLGRAIAAHFLVVGANIVVCDINQKLLDDFQTQVSAAHPDRTLAMVCDITWEDTLDELFAAAESKFGRLDYVVNNAAVMDKFDPIGDMDTAIWERVMAVNLKAPAMIMRRAIRGFLQHGTKGAIVNISSVAGIGPFEAGAAYTTSKHGLIGLTKNTAAYYQSNGIRANVIAAGAMRTNIADAFATGVNQAGLDYMLAARPRVAQGKQAFCDLEKMAKLVAYLCSEDAEMINGAVYVADAGITLP